MLPAMRLMLQPTRFSKALPLIFEISLKQLETIAVHYATVADRCRKCCNCLRPGNSFLATHCVKRLQAWYMRLPIDIFSFRR